MGNGDGDAGRRVRRALRGPQPCWPRLGSWGGSEKGEERSGSACILKIRMQIGCGMSKKERNEG